jgi:hypothetical protein
LIESNEMPGENCLVALKTAQKETDLVVKRINAFMAKDYAAFVKVVNGETMAPIFDKYGW